MRVHIYYSVLISGLIALLSPSLMAQCNRPYIKIDGERVLADNSQTQNGLTLPLWLKEGRL